MLKSTDCANSLRVVSDDLALSPREDDGACGTFLNGPPITLLSLRTGQLSISCLALMLHGSSEQSEHRGVFEWNVLSV